MDTYSTGGLNKVRKGDRAHYDRETVHAILDAGLVAHAGFGDGDGTGRDWPMVIPMIYARIGETLYLHGAKAARIAKTLSRGIPACVTVTHVDGLVLARSAFHSSMNYRSVVVHGVARPVEDREEKIRALAEITDHIAPGRWDEAREMTDKELASTGVVAVPIAHAAAKVRTGGPKDDEEDYALPVWAGVVPVRQTFGAPYDDGRLAEGVELPDSVKRAMARNG